MIKNPFFARVFSKGTPGKTDWTAIVRIRHDLGARRKLEGSPDLTHHGRSLDNAPVHIEDMLTSEVVVNAAAARKFEILLVTRHSARILEFSPE
jgi:hypothetical protein